jgi:hypothetical protein
MSDQLVEAASQQLFEIKGLWLSSRLRNIISLRDRENIDGKFQILENYVNRGNLSQETLEFFLTSLSIVSNLIYEHYYSFGIRF